ncbi:ComEC/Rec2 family competence protein [Candidatus Saccharibacteria bacterium]|nr:ComEC/Rec2 family competence protein [Candidatus Saccharibacteria bacterium]
MLKRMWGFVHQSYLVIALAVGIVVGAILAIVFRVNYFNSPVWLAVVIMILTAVYLRPRLIFIGIVFVVGMVLVFFRVSSQLIGENYIRQFWGQTIKVTGIVEADPNSDESATKLKISNLKFGKEEKQTQGIIYISLKHNEKVRRADEVVFEGKLSEGFGIYAGYMYRPYLKRIKRAEPKDTVLLIRDTFSERIKRLIPEPEVNLGLSYLLGMKAGLPEDLSENLRIVGLTHIVVASGAHLSILVGIAWKIFGKLSRFAGLFFSIGFVLFFMCMVGWTPSILRAGVMAILSLITWYCGRKMEPWRLILITMAFTLMLNPMFLINLGWLLSFASYAGIMILGPRLIEFFYGVKKPGFIASTILVTISATLMTLPISLYFYGTLSLISVLANLLILPTLSAAMGCVFMAGVVAGIPGVEQLVGYVATKILDFHIIVIEFFGGMKEFMVEISPYQIWVFTLYVIILAPFLLKWIYRKRKITSVL